MLKRLQLKNAGPVSEVDLEFGDRLNLVTGDNGLGKSFLLDAIWFALTRTWPSTWPGHGAQPNRETRGEATIRWENLVDNNLVSATARFDPKSQAWEVHTAAKLTADDRLPPLVVFARVDGGFSVWDAARKGQAFRRPFGGESWGSSSSFQFSPVEVWEGLTIDGGRRVCEGMWRDLALWPLLPGQGLFNELNTSLERFGGSENLRLTTASERVVIDESRDVPVLETAAGRVPIVHASAAVKRILSLSYVITWAWREHKEAAQLQQVEPATGMVLMVDEIESHLHPKWQRTILPALAHNGEQQGRPIQVFVTTHSPLVMASAEPGFDPTKDAWFDFDLIAGRPHVQRRTFVNHGDVSNWLTSEAFDLKTAGSVPAEKALEKARALLQEPSPTLERARQITAELEAAGLKDIDAFWGRWDFFVKKLESSQ